MADLTPVQPGYNCGRKGQQSIIDYFKNLTRLKVTHKVMCCWTCFCERERETIYLKRPQTRIFELIILAIMINMFHVGIAHMIYTIIIYINETVFFKRNANSQMQVYSEKLTGSNEGYILQVKK